MTEEVNGKGSCQQETARCLTKIEGIKIKPAELEKVVIELYKQGENIAKIGLILRDKYGIPKAKILGKKIKVILEEANVAIRSEKEIVQKRIDSLNRHIEKNKHDQPAKKKLSKELWALKRV